MLTLCLMVCSLSLRMTLFLFKVSSWFRSFSYWLFVFSVRLMSFVKLVLIKFSML
jgi:hypothetical protein